MATKKPELTPASITSLTREDLAPILQQLEALEARCADHDALLGEHEERLVSLEGVSPPEEPGAEGEAP